MVTAYKCPYCSGNMQPDGQTGLLCCGECGSKCEPGELIAQSNDEFIAKLNETRAPQAQLDGYICKNCGAQIVTTSGTHSTFCCFCGAPATVPAKIEGVERPELIIPFKTDKRAAQRAFGSWLSKKLLISRGFAENVKAGKISGIFVPFWLYDCEVETALHAKSAASTHYRSTVSTCTNVPADASEHLDEQLMEMLGPFDYTQAVEFDKKYTDGYFSEKYGYSAERLASQIKECVDEKCLHAARETLAQGQDVISVTSCEHRYTALKAKCILLPVWTVNCTYNNYTHQLFMNGQTGKIIGNPPVSAKQLLLWFGGIAGAVACVGELICLAVNLL